MTDDELLRYARHILLDDLGIEGQQRLHDAHALIIGAGGLGCPAAMYLAASGVGTITLVDDDVVDLSNLQRQIAHTTARVGDPKVHSLRDAVQALNPLARVHTCQQRADAALLDTLVPRASVVLDCCDNYRTRHAVNAACVRHGVPLVSGAAIGLQGQVGVFDTRGHTRCDARHAPSRSPDDSGQGEPGSDSDHGNGPCYACLFDPQEAPPEIRCAHTGVLAPLVGVIGSMQAVEALKLLACFGIPARHRLLLLDARSLQWRTMQTARNPDCSVCGPLRQEP